MNQKLNIEGRNFCNSSFSLVASYSLLRPYVFRLSFANANREKKFLFSKKKETNEKK
jgi:hypothetical protein